MRGKVKGKKCGPRGQKFLRKTLAGLFGAATNTIMATNIIAKIPSE